MTEDWVSREQEKFCGLSRGRLTRHVAEVVAVVEEVARHLCGDPATGEIVRHYSTGQPTAERCAQAFSTELAMEEVFRHRSAGTSGDDTAWLTAPLVVLREAAADLEGRLDDMCSAPAVVDAGEGFLVEAGGHHVPEDPGDEVYRGEPLFRQEDCSAALAAHEHLRRVIHTVGRRILWVAGMSRDDGVYRRVEERVKEDMELDYFTGKRDLDLVCGEVMLGPEPDA